jgi:hypothetical protein
MDTTYVVVLAAMLTWACLSSACNSNEDPLVVHPHLQQPLQREQRLNVLAVATAPIAVEAHSAASHPGVSETNSKPLLLLEFSANQAAPNPNAEIVIGRPSFGGAPSEVDSGGAWVLFKKLKANYTDGFGQKVSASILQ